MKPTFPIPKNLQENIKIGSCITFVFGQPGDDTSQGYVTKIENGIVNFIDIWFNIPCKEKLENVWLTTQQELNSIVYSQKYGTLSCKEQFLNFVCKYLKNCNKQDV
jgi:hypothetical protein